MEFQARFPAVTARAAAFEDDGDRIMVLFKDGVPVEILQADVFNVVYELIQEQKSSSVAKPAPNGKVKRPHKHKVDEKTAAKPAEAGHGERTAEIMALIRKKPMSSGELIEHLKCNSSIVYSTTHVMKEKGMIEGKISDEDGTRRWFPKGLM